MSFGWDFITASQETVILLSDEGLHSFGYKLHLLDNVNKSKIRKQEKLEIKVLENKKKKKG